MTAVADRRRGQVVEVKLDHGTGNMMVAETDVPSGWERIRRPQTDAPST